MLDANPLQGEHDKVMKMSDELWIFPFSETVAIATISKDAAKNVTSSLGETGSITCHLEGNMEVGQELKIFRVFDINLLICYFI